MFVIKKRSSGSLLKEAKKLIVDAGKNPQTRPQNFSLLSHNSQVKINENKRNRDTPDYVQLSPHEFMSWWITSTGAKRKASNYLLHYMKFRFNADIPMDYRTLLRTPVKPVPLPMHPGAYMHVGVHRALFHLLSEVADVKSTFPAKVVLMQFFVDGLKIKKSVRSDAWIIMMNIRYTIKKRLRLVPKVIGVYYGTSKPEDFNDFLWPFVMELLELLEKGIEFDDVELKLKILNFVLDAPARCYCKMVKGVNGYFGCDVCVEEGDFIDHRMVFLNMNAAERNDVEYRTRVYDDQDYHHHESVLEHLPIDGNVMPLTQITNRIIEIYQSPKHKFGKASHIAEVKGRQEDGTFLELIYHDLHFHTELEGQNYVFLKSGRSVKLVSIFQSGVTSEIVLIGKPIKNCSSVFNHIVDTTRFNIFKSKLEFSSSIAFRIEDIDGKLWKMAIPDSKEFAFYPIYIEDAKSYQMQFIK